MTAHRASTGPRTPGGKARAAQNARRHRLNVPVMAEAAFAPEVEALARDVCAILGGAKTQNAAYGPMPEAAPDAALLELARRVAAAQIDLARVGRARHDLVARALAEANPHSGAAIATTDGRSVAETPDDISGPQGAECFAAILGDLSCKLAIIDRYERRARSRRKLAVRDFDEACATRTLSCFLAKRTGKCRRISMAGVNAPNVLSDCSKANRAVLPRLVETQNS
jgi:hypothetical protein